MFGYVLALASPASADVPVRMKQTIRPVPCGIDHLIDSNGISHYFTPRECGRLVVPAPPASSDQTSVVELPDGIAPTKPLYLNSTANTNGSAGYMLLAREGMVYSFRLRGDNPLLAPRTFEIIKVENGVVTIHFEPGGKTIALKKGERVKIDLAYDGDPDIGFIVEEINSEGVVSLRVWFPLQQRMVGLVDNNHALFVSIMIFTLSSVVIYINMQIRLSRAREWLLLRAWHRI